MGDKPEKAVIIGLDGANPAKVLSLVSQGKLPHIGRLLREGTLCSNALAPYPTLTGSNWQTIATGAWPGTHGVTDMSYHVTGEPLAAWESGFTSKACRAEYIWEALGRAGKRSILLKYTGSWPPRGVNGIQVDGGGGRPFWGGSMLELSHSLLFSTEPYPNGVLIDLQPAKGWDEAPGGALEARIVLQPSTGNIPEFLQYAGEQVVKGQGVVLQGLLRPDGSFVLSSGKKVRGALADVAAGQWSPTLIMPFTFQGRGRRGMFRFKVLGGDTDSSKLTLYVTQIYPVDEFCAPAEIGPELVEEFGCFFNHPGFSEAAMGWFEDDPATFIELIDMQNEWLARAGAWLMEKRQWDLFMMQAHTIDFANHLYLPHHDTSAAEAAANEKLLDRCYASVDRLVGGLTEKRGGETLVVLVSDHGATVSPGKEIDLNEILAQAGLLSYEQADEADAVRRRVDMKRTKAIQQRSSFVYVNLRGREPEGIVPAEEYEQVREQIIDALYRYRDPETGRAAFSLVWRKEEARILGLWDSHGRDIGDVVYAVYPEFDHEHGRQLPTARLGGQEMRALLLFAGAGVRRGVLLERNTWLVDVVPTVAAALGWPIPAQADGAVLHQVFGTGAGRSLPGISGVEEKGTGEKGQGAAEAAAGVPGGLDERLVQSLREQLGQKEKQIAQLQEQLAQAAGQAAETTGPGTVTEPSVVHEPGAAQGPGETEVAASLREQLAQARHEAQRWKSAYERYHKITHGN